MFRLFCFFIDLSCDRFQTNIPTFSQFLWDGCENRTRDLFQGTASLGNTLSGGNWAADADDASVNAYQMYYQWANGTGASTRNFDQNSVMGSQMLQTDYVRAGILRAAS